MISWSEVDTMTFCDNITQFLSEHSNPGPKIAQDTTSDTIATFNDDKVLLLFFVFILHYFN